MTLAAPAKARNLADETDLGLDFFSPEGIRADMDLLARTIAPDLTGDRRARFHGALNRIQAETYPFSTSDGNPLFIFRESSGVSRKMLADLLVLPEAPPSWEYSDFEVARLIRDTHRAFDLLASIAPGLTAALREMIGALIFAQQKKFAGGSLSAHVGVILFSCRPDWTTEEYAGHILHEAVHQRLFLHDMLHGLFAIKGGNLAEPEALITSSILRTKRPYDRAYHSAFVLHALMQYYRALGKDDAAPGTAADILRTLGELEEKRQYLLPKGLECVRALRRAVVR